MTPDMVSLLVMLNMKLNAIVLGHFPLK